MLSLHHRVEFCSNSWTCSPNILISWLLSLSLQYVQYVPCSGSVSGAIKLISGSLRQASHDWLQEFWPIPPDRTVFQFNLAEALRRLLH